jgi:hypothetical protein
MSVVIGLVIMIVAAVAASHPATPLRQARVTAGLAGTAVAVFVALCAWAMGVRGGRPGTTLFLISLVALCGYGRFIMEGKFSDLVAPDDGTLVGRPKLHAPSPGRTVAMGLCGILAVAAWSVPLRFAGALVDDNAGSAVAKVLSFGQFGPLGVRREIADGQCLEARLADRKNVVVPCGYPHKAEVVGEVNDETPCPEVDATEYHAGPMRVVRTKPISGVVFCILQAMSPQRTWRLPQPELATGNPMLPNTT